MSIVAGSARRRGRFRRAFSAFAAVVTAVALWATPAHASSVTQQFCRDYVPTAYSVCMYVGWDTDEHLRIDTSDTVENSSADICIVTVWGSMDDSVTTWQTPHMVQNCNPPKNSTAYSWNTFYNAPTNAYSIVPHMCITLRWTGGSYYWQKCFSGSKVWEYS